MTPLQPDTNPGPEPLVPSIHSHLTLTVKFLSDKRECDGVVPNNGPYQGNSSSTSGRSTTPNGTHRSATHIKLVHWNAQGEITKTFAIKTAIVQVDPDIVMMQATGYKHRLDDLPNLRIHGYHT